MRTLAEQHNRNQREAELEADRDVFADDVFTTFPGRPTMRGFAEFLTVSREFHTAFSDFDGEIGVVVENEDAVAVEGIWKATNSGPMPGPAGELPPTNKRINLPFVDVMVGKNGRVVEHRLYFDQAALIQQLGLMPG